MLIELAEQRWLPDWAIRRGIRHLLRKRLQKEIQREQASLSRAAALRETFATGPIAVETTAANQQHYEVPTELFQAMLGPRLKYSGCYWKDFVGELAQAEEAMLRLTCERARIEDGQRILDLGCGWGSLSLWLAEKYPQAEIVAVSNSRTQGEFIREQAAERSLENVAHVVANMADGDPKSRLESEGLFCEGFDRIVSVEMFEHMHNVEALLESLAAVLQHDGLLFVHVFSHKHLFYRFQDEGPADWMTRHFFSGGAMPPSDLFRHIHGPFELVERHDVNGQHYAKTCHAWLHNLDRYRKELLARFEQDMHSKQARVQWQRWRMFVMACEELFAWNDGEEWLVTHHLLRLSRKR